MRDLREASNEEVDNSVRDGDLMTLEDLVLSGRGHDLRGRSAWNEDTRRFLKRVPAYMVSVRGHCSGVTLIQGHTGYSGVLGHSWLCMGHCSGVTLIQGHTGHR